jgi:succinate dehydrogenase/fumarate reductase-like Fe-S protein
VDGNVVLIGKDQAETAMDAASCIGCGACVAACKNASAMLFVAAKVSHLALLPQGKPERTRRVTALMEAMDREGFGACGNQYECEAVCPKSPFHRRAQSRISSCRRRRIRLAHGTGSSPRGVRLGLSQFQAQRARRGGLLAVIPCPQRSRDRQP